MARSPLIHAFSRAYRLIRGARDAGVPLDEFAARDAERRALSRRRFLETAAAAATVPLIASCGGDETNPPEEDKSVVIVGGGIAGLHCAYRLKKLGVTAKVYEAQSRVGGRMYSDRSTFPDGQHCELGGELIDTGHQTMHDLATEFGIELYDYTNDKTNDMGDPITSSLAYIGGGKLTEGDILTGFAPIAQKIDEALATLTDQDDLFVYYNKPNGGEKLDALSLSAWFDEIGATGYIRTLLEVAYNIEYGLEADVTNVLNMMFLISTDTMKFDVFGESDELFHTKTGNDTFITKLAEALDPEQIELESALVAIKSSSDGRYVLTFQKGMSTFDVTAAHVVLALPFTILRELDIQVELPPEKKLAINELGYGTNAKLMVGFNTRPWRDKPNLSNGETFTDLGYQSTWETSRLQPGASGIITHFTGGKVGLAAGDGTPEDRATAFIEQFDVVFPGVKAASSGKAVRFHWPTNPWVKGSYSAYKVGQYTTITGAEAEPVGNIHFCGEHTSLDAQGYMEGGALSGAIAADEIATALGINTQKPQSYQLSQPRQVWMPGQRILARARSARENRRWHAAITRWRKAG